MLYLLMSLLICGEDQNIKNKVDKTTELGEETSFCGGKIIKTKVYNKSAFLNFLDKKPNLLRGISILLMVVLLITYVNTLFSKGKHGLKLGLTFITGGALSNVYDRIKRGHVIDYFKVKYIKNVVFNIGDVFIFLGSLILLIRGILKRD